MEKLLEHAVVVLLAKDNDNHLGVAEDTARTIHHVLKELGLDLNIIILVLQLDPVRLFDFDLEQLARLSERAVNAISDLEVRALTMVRLIGVLVDHDPIFARQIDCLLDRQPLQRLLTALNYLARAEQLNRRSTEAEAIQRDGHLLDLESPVLHGALTCELGHHSLDLVDLLLRGDAGHSEGITHASTLSDGIGNTVEEAELHGQVVMLLSHLDQEARLVSIGHRFLVDDLEVAGQLDWLVIPDELVGQRSNIEGDIVNAIGALVAPVSDDRFVSELHANDLVPLVVGMARLPKLVNAIQASLGRHELEDVVDGESHSELALKRRGLETRPHGQTDA